MIWVLPKTLGVDFSNSHDDGPPQLLPDATDYSEDWTCDWNSDHDNDDPIANVNSNQLQQNEGARDDTIPNEEDVDSLRANENADNLGTNENDDICPSSDDENDGTHVKSQSPRRSNRLANAPREVNYGNTILVTIDNNHIDDQNDNFN